MEQYLVSHDYADMEDISLEKLLEITFDPKTSDEYADYLLYVLKKAKQTLKSVDQTLIDIQFTYHSNGCIAPFGEGGHPFCKNLYNWVNRKDLPPFPDDLSKAQ